MGRRSQMESMERLEGKSVLVTGGAGFIGSHLVELLLKKNYHVIVVDTQKPNRCYFFLNNLDKKVDYQCLDITHQKDITTLFTSQRLHYVIHLAALSTVEEAYKNPRKAFQTNIMGTVNILEACRSVSGIKGILVASSDKAYGKTKKIYTESSPLKGDHPYDVSKSSEDLIAQTYYKTYGLPVIVTRFGNVYGEGDLHFDRIIPGICKAVITGQSVAIRSDGTYIRDYVYVKDVAFGYMFLMKKSRELKGEAFNFSSNNTCSVLELVRNAQRILKTKIPYKIFNTSINEIPYQHLDDSKIRKLGWKSVYSLEKALPKTLHWYRNFYE